MTARPYTPRTLAERWGCSDRHIRDLIKKNKLPAFKVGSLVRIGADVVERIEACGLSNIGDTGAFPGQPAPGQPGARSVSPPPKVVSVPNAP